MRTLWASVALLLLAGFQPVQAEPSAAADPVLDAPFSAQTVGQLLDRVERQWWRRHALVNKGDLAGIDRATQEFVALLEEEKIERLEPFADAAVLEAQRQAALGNDEVARRSLELAQRLDPSHAAASWDLALLQGAAGAGQTAAWQLRWGAIKNSWRSYWWGYALLLHLASWLLLGLLMAGAVLVVVLMLRHAPRLVHEVDERLPAQWHPTWRRTIAAALILAPLAVIKLGVWALLLWAVLLIPAATRAERRALFGALGLLALAVPAGNGLRVLTEAADSQSARVAIASAEGSLRPDLMAELLALAEAHPSDPTWKVQLARLLSNHHADQAAHLLRDAAQLAPTDARIRLMLGNLYFRLGKQETAAVLYREALELDKQNVVSMFNLGRVREALFQFPAANEVYAAARKLDPATLDRLQRENPEGVAEPTIGTSEVAHQVFSEEAGPGLRHALRPGNFVTLVALAALFGALVLRIRSGSLQTKRCPRCGRASCSRCPGEREATGKLCAACERLFSKSGAISPQARQQQGARVDSYLRRIGRGRSLANLLWPGTAQLHEGRTGLGVLLCGGWGVLLAMVLFPAPLLAAGPIVTPLPWQWIARALLLAFLMLSQLPPLRPRAATAWA